MQPANEFVICQLHPISFCLNLYYMKEITTIVKEYAKIDFTTTRAALATVVRVDGSSYRREGARMLVLDNGMYIGGVSGGCLEADVFRKTARAIIRNKPSVITYDTTQDDEHQIGVGLGCNGIIDVLINPLDPADEQNLVRLLSKIIATKNPTVIISVTQANEKSELFGKTFLYENDKQFSELFTIDSLRPTLLQDINECLKKQRSKTFTYQYDTNIIAIFIEVIMPVTKLVVYGGNYDIHPLVTMANELGWDVSIITKLTKTSMSLISSAKMYHPDDMENLIIDQHTAVVLMSHDYKTDLHNFMNVIHTNCFYIGLLGPKKRSQKIFDAFTERDLFLSENVQQKIFAPAGLDIGALTPEEIALSILAEIRSCKAGRQGASLRLRSQAIHEN
jgi:xanthine dehydrogenase accessory factor